MASSSKPFEYVSGAASSSSSSSPPSLTPKDAVKIKNEKIEEEKSVLLDATPESDTLEDGEGKKNKPQLNGTSVVLLSSSEGDIFELEESSAMLSGLIKNLIEDDCAGNVIPLANISSEVLGKAVEFLKKHGEIKERDETEKEELFIEWNEKQELIEWNEKFIKDLEGNSKTLFGLALAADFLNARCLLDVSCQAIADMIKDKSPEWVSRVFNIKNDFTPEEEAEVRKENAWAFDD